MANPYSVPGEDDDLFAPRKQDSRFRHTLGELCPSCGLYHDVVIDASRGDLPPEVRAKLDEILDDLPAEAKNAKIIVTDASHRNPELIMEAFKQFTTEIEGINRTGPVLRAVAEILDAQTGGEVSRRWRVYQLEQSLMVAHALINSVSNVLAHHGEDSPGNKAYRAVLDDLAESCAARLRDIVGAYRSAAEELGWSVDETLISVGRYAPDAGNQRPFAEGVMALGFTKLVDPDAKKLPPTISPDPEG